MQLSMRRFQALEVQASPSSCNMNFNNTFFQLTALNFKLTWFHDQDQLKEGNFTYNIQFSTES